MGKERDAFCLCWKLLLCVNQKGVVFSSWTQSLSKPNVADKG